VNLLLGVITQVITLRGLYSKSKVSEVSETLDYARIMKVGDHGVLFYRRPCEKHKVLFNFLQAGFQNGEGAIYVASQENSEQIRRHMENFGFNVKALEKDGALKIYDYNNWYIINGEVNVSHLAMMSQHVFDEAMEIGLKGLRGCGETACFFEHKKQKELVEYELMIGRKLSLPVTALCAYAANDAKSLEDKFFISLIRAHGPVVTSSFAQEITFENLFPPITNNVLETMFGEMGKKTILEILAERYSLTPNKIAEDPVAFIEGLEKLLGSGAYVITKSLVRKMHLKIGIRR